MKRKEFLRHLRVYGCVLKREGGRHSLYQNPANGVIEAVPRYIEIDNRLVKKICKRLEVPQPGKQSKN